jgi:hypothetical protein
LRGGFRFGFLYIDTAFEQGPVFDTDARGGDVADKFRILADIDLVARLHSPLHLAEDDHIAGFNAGLNSAIGPDGDLIVERLDGPLNITIDIEIFFGENLADDLY